jgi:hypothetical protein
MGRNYVMPIWQFYGRHHRDKTAGPSARPASHTASFVGYHRVIS